MQLILNEDDLALAVKLFAEHKGLDLLRSDIEVDFTTTRIGSITSSVATATVTKREPNDDELELEALDEDVDFIRDGILRKMMCQRAKAAASDSRMDEATQAVRGFVDAISKAVNTDLDDEEDDIDYTADTESDDSVGAEQVAEKATEAEEQEEAKEETKEQEATADATAEDTTEDTADVVEETVTAETATVTEAVKETASTTEEAAPVTAEKVAEAPTAPVSGVFGKPAG